MDELVTPVKSHAGAESELNAGFGGFFNGVKHEQQRIL